MWGSSKTLEAEEGVLIIESHTHYVIKFSQHIPCFLQITVTFVICATLLKIRSTQQRLHNKDYIFLTLRIVIPFFF